jgi:hypothetical protein
MNALPPAVFLLIHVVLFIIGVIFARRSFSTGQGTVGWGFTLFAVAEATYMTYHLDWTVFLFAHTLAEVLDALAFILIFAAVSQKMLAARG